MAAAQLTERQQEIKKLLDAGKTPREVGEALEITENAVYQHIRRMRTGGTKLTTATSRGSNKSGNKSGNKSSGSRSRSRRATPTPAPAATEPRPMTPLQAIRARMSVIELEHREADNAVTSAERALKSATESAEKVKSRHDAELAQLRTAEGALTGKPVWAAPKKAPTRQRPSRAKGSRAAANGATADDARPPAEAPPAAEAADTPPAPPAPPAEPAQAELSPDAAPK